MSGGVAGRRNPGGEFFQFEEERSGLVCAAQTLQQFGLAFERGNEVRLFSQSHIIGGQCLAGSVLLFETSGRVRGKGRERFCQRRAVAHGGIRIKGEKLFPCRHAVRRATEIKSQNQAAVETGVTMIGARRNGCVKTKQGFLRFAESAVHRAEIRENIRSARDFS